MNRPSHGDLIQKIQELKAKELTLVKRAANAEQLLNDITTLIELGERPSDAVIKLARDHIKAHQTRHDL